MPARKVFERANDLCAKSYETYIGTISLAFDSQRTFSNGLAAITDVYDYLRVAPT